MCVCRDCNDSNFSIHTEMNEDALLEAEDSYRIRVWAYNFCGCGMLITVYRDNYCIYVRRFKSLKIYILFNWKTTLRN